MWKINFYCDCGKKWLDLFYDVSFYMMCGVISYENYDHV